MNKIDVEKIRKDFSIFEYQKLTYLDSAATSLTPDCVVDSMSDYYKKYRSSVHRGNYKLGQKASSTFDEARQTIGEYFSCAKEEIIFTKSTTSSLNLIAHTLEEKLDINSEIIVTNLEHHSNFLPWKILSDKVGCKLVIVKAKNKQISSDQVLDHITDNTKIIAIHHVSNVIGNEVDIAKITNISNSKGIISVIDGAQAAPHQEINFQKLNCHFYTISAHKMFGPTGLGILYINQNIQRNLAPLEYGGGMVEPSTVDYEKSTFKTGVEKFEAGTPSIAEVIGFGQAIKYIKKLGIKNIQQHEESLKKYAVQEFEKISDKIVMYNEKFKSGILIFNIKNVSVHDAVSESMISNVTFDSQNIAIRDGQHCNNLTMKHVLKTKAVLRASFSIYNDKKDIDMLVNQIKKIYKIWN